VNGSVIPGMIGMEAGQSAFGDAYAWFKNILTWPLQNILSKSTTVDADTLKKLIDETSDKIISELSRQAEQLPLEEEGEIAVDWLNGRRTPDANQTLEGAITGLSLGTDAPRMFRAIAEATCFGAKAIVERFIEQGIPVKGLIGLGGVAKKSPFIMQMMADVVNMPIRIHKSEQTCALGAAMFAATAAGLYARVEDAMDAMGQGFDAEYHPNTELVPLYKQRYEKYKQLGRFVEGMNSE
jgi:L-ribulokinase